jgi:hypothetical protein
MNNKVTPESQGLLAVRNNMPVTRNKGIHIKTSFLGCLIVSPFMLSNVKENCAPLLCMAIFLQNKFTERTSS